MFILDNYKFIFNRSMTVLFVSGFLSTFFATHLQADKLLIYGTSYHFDDNNGLGYNELNWGLGYSKAITEQVAIEGGIFLNSFDDLAAYIAFDYTAIDTERWTAGVNLRHWETMNNTYENRLVVPYPYVTLNLSSNLALKTLLRSSGPIFYIELSGLQF